MSPDARPDVTIVTSGHDVADARLHRLTRALVRHGASVEVLGLGAETDGPTGASVRTWPRGSMVGRGARGLTMARAARGRVLLALDPDSLLWARVVGRLTRRPVVADVHEDYRRMLEDRAWAQGVLGRGARVVARAAETVASRADLTLVADEHVPPGSARRRLVVRNEADKEPHRTLAAVGRAPPRGLRRGRARQPRALRDARRAAGGTRVDPRRRRTRGLRGPARRRRAPRGRARALRRGSRGTAASRRRRPGRSPTVRGSASPCSRTPRPSATPCPRRLHEYIAAGLIPVVTPLPRQARLCDEVGGFVVADGEEAGQVLRSLAADPAARTRLTAPEATVARTSYDEAAEAIVGLLP